MQIFVKTASSQTIALEAEAADTVCTLKSRFYEKTGWMLASSRPPTLCRSPTESSSSLSLLLLSVCTYAQPGLMLAGLVPENLRLYLGGALLPNEQTLLECRITDQCTLSQSFVLLGLQAGMCFTSAKCCRWSSWS
jgi:hypothetical protein